MTPREKIEAAAKAGAAAAAAVWDEKSWRKAPAQCPVCADLIKGETGASILPILTAWTQAYAQENSRRADLALAASP